MTARRTTTASDGRGGSGARRWLAATLVLVGLGLVAAFVVVGRGPSARTSPPTAAPTSTSPPAPTSTAAGHVEAPSHVEQAIGSGPAVDPTPSVDPLPAFDHIVVLVEENHGLRSVVGNAAAPYLNSLASSYALATGYRATTHPSLPNYIELTSGTTAGIGDDCNPPGGSCTADVPSIADQLEGAALTWRAYLDAMPAPCTTRNASTYAVKHNPFLYYPQIRNDQARCRAHDVPLDQLEPDLATPGALPRYALVVPDLCHDMHDCSVRTGDDWLRQFVPTLLASPAFTAERSLLVITFDESEGGDTNTVPAVFVGPQVKGGFVTNTAYSHDALLHTIEAAWRLPPLTARLAAAPLISDIFR